MKKTILQKNKEEIIWNLINSLLVGIISFLSVLAADKEFSFQAVLIGLVFSLMTAVIKFGEYWKSQEGEYKSKILSIL